MHHISTSHYPFTAIVGQEQLKTALLLNAINPLIGGVLIRGAKGTAKSTAARALAEVLPDIEVVADCAYNCHPDNVRLMCDRCAERFERNEPLPRALRPVPFITLPLSATEDRLAGTIDVGAALTSGSVSLKPGLLAEAHRGILYVDEVNLLDDHLVNLLLDAAAMGRNIVEREGVSAAHPARFILIGTMNPEEGELRPQLLDRFGITVEVETISDVAQRVEIIRLLDRYDRDPTMFLHEFEQPQQELRTRIMRAMALLPEVVVGDEVRELAARMALEAGVDGHRADVALVRVAVTLAAFREAQTVTRDHLAEAAPLVLSHRMRRMPFEQPRQLQSLVTLPEPRQDSTPAEPPQHHPSESEKKSVHVMATLPPATAQGSRKGSGAGGSKGARGKKLGSKPFAAPEDKVDVAASLLSAAVREGPHRSQRVPAVRQDDIKAQRTRTTAKRMVCFVVDSSGSMGARQRIHAVRLACRQLLEQTYQEKFEVMLVTAGGTTPLVAIPPIRDVEQVDRAVAALPTSGKTPLAAALQLALKQLEVSRNKGFAPALVVLTDGRANVPLHKGSDPVADALSVADLIAQAGIDCLVVDTENDFVNLGISRDLAQRMNARYVQSTTDDPQTIASWARSQP